MTPRYSLEKNSSAATSVGSQQHYANVVFMTPPPRQDIPVVIPADQAYYWSEKWQTSQRRALADLEAGRSRRFSTVDDALLYLFNITD